MCLPEDYLRTDLAAEKAAEAFGNSLKGDDISACARQTRLFTE